MEVSKIHSSLSDRSVSLCLGLSLVMFFGCARFREESTGVTALEGTIRVGPGQVSIEELEGRLMDFADTYVMRITQAHDTVEERTPDPDIRNLSHRKKMLTSISAYDIATDRNPVAGLLNMVVMVTLSRIVLEEYWVPKVFSEQGQSMLVMYRKGEAEVWSLAREVLTDQQQQQMKTLIAQWREDNPTTRYVAFIRFNDFAAVRGQSIDLRKEPSGSIFRLFYLDPLANLDPIAQEVRFSRLFAERAFFYAQRLPSLLVGYSQEAYYDILAASETRKLLKDIDRFATVSERLATTLEQLPEEVSEEREAAIRQMDAVVSQWSDAAIDRMSQRMEEVVERRTEAAINQTAEKVAAEREAILAELKSQQFQLQDLLCEARETAGALTGLATAVNTAILSLDRFVSRFDQGNGPPSEKPPQEMEKGKPFNIKEYGEAGTRIGEGAQNVREMFTSLGALLDSPSLKGEESVVTVSMTELRKTGQAIVDRAFRYLLILILLILLGVPTVLLVYKHASRHLQPTRSNRGEGRPS